MLNQLPKPFIIAHRGASAYAPENSLAAFSLALKQEADAIELDVKLTKDNQVIVMHDQTVNRTTNGSGYVKDLLLSEIRKLDCGSHFDVEFKGEKVPTLDEVLAQVGKITYVNIELTNYSTPIDELARYTAEVVLQHQLDQRVFFSSFNPIVLVRIRKLLPDAPIGLLALPGKSGYLARSRLGLLLSYKSLNLEKNDVTKSLVEKIHSRGKKTLVYTVNDKETMEKLFSFGIDGIFTDDPILARKTLESIRQ